MPGSTWPHSERRADLAALEHLKLVQQPIRRTTEGTARLPEWQSTKVDTRVFIVPQHPETLAWDPAKRERDYKAMRDRAED